MKGNEWEPIDRCGDIRKKKVILSVISTLVVGLLSVLGNTGVKGSLKRKNGADSIMWVMGGQMRLPKKTEHRKELKKAF